jgi:hypothetical protein
VQLDAYPAALQALRTVRAALAATRADGFDGLWAQAFASPPQPELPDGVEVTHVTGLGSAATPVDALLLESVEPIRWERTEAVLEVVTATAQPLRIRVLQAADAGDPDRGAFRWAGVDTRTDVELRTRLGVVGPRVAGAWTLELSVPDARRVRVQLTVAGGGTAKLTGLGPGTGGSAMTGPTGAAGPVTLEVTGTALTVARLTGTGLAVLSVEVEQPFEPVPASGPLRLTRGVLPPAPGPATHSVDVAAYADTELAGHRITWTDARTPSVGGDYHLFAPGTSIRDGRTARVYGGVATTPADGGVDLYAGGTVGVVPTTGVVFRLLAPDGRVVHELVTLPDSAFVAAPPVRIWANGDLTRAFVLNGAVLPKGTGRLRLRENPLLIRSLMQALGLTELALEWHEDLAPITVAFLAGRPMADHPLLWFGDGRITAGHLAFLRERAAAGPLRLTLFDGTIGAGWDWSQRDEAMAGAHLARQRPGVREIRISYGSGRYYNNEPRQFRRRIGGRRSQVLLYQQHDSLVLDLPSAGEAVVPQRPLPWPAGSRLG